MYTYKPSGVCSQQINYEITDGIISNVSFVGGCEGNLKGIAALVEGLPVSSVIQKLSGITCGRKKTSCPDQLSKALESVK